MEELQQQRLQATVIQMLQTQLVSPPASASVLLPLKLVLCSKHDLSKVSVISSPRLSVSPSNKRISKCLMILTSLTTSHTCWSDPVSFPPKATNVANPRPHPLLQHTTVSRCASSSLLCSFSTYKLSFGFFFKNCTAIFCYAILDLQKIVWW